jgi:hypothetical protein
VDKSKFKNRKEWRKFGIGLSIVLAILTILRLIFSAELSLYLIIPSFPVLGFALFLPVVLKPLFVVMSYVGFVMSWVITRIAMTILFYLVFTPIGFIGRLFGKRFLDLKFIKDEDTYWIAKDRKETGSGSYESQF